MAEIEKKTKRYPTDLTDEEWARIEQFLPGAAKSGRPARTDLREVLNAIRFWPRSGGGWRMLPKDFPPWPTVYWCKPALAVTSPAGKHFMTGDAELERIGIRIVVYPQDILAASVRAMRDGLAGLKGGTKPPMATPAELATAIRIAEYLSQDFSLARAQLESSRWHRSP